MGRSIGAVIVLAGALCAAWAAGGARADLITSSDGVTAVETGSWELRGFGWNTSDGSNRLEFDRLDGSTFKSSGVLDISSPTSSWSLGRDESDCVSIDKDDESDCDSVYFSLHHDGVICDTSYFVRSFTGDTCNEYGKLDWHHDDHTWTWTPNWECNPVPEPSTLVLLGAGGLGFLWRRRAARRPAK